MTVVAVTRDLLDRSKIGAGVPGARVVGSPRELADVVATVILVDLRVDGALEAALATGASVIAYGSHVDDEALASAGGLGATALPRSLFFRRLREGTLLP